jgi:succinyl-CoA synthetase beta subunit
MRIHEYQAKQLFAEAGIPVAAARTAASVEEAVAAADQIGYPVVVKAQIHAGGRGKGGGIQRVEGEDELRAATHRILGMCLVTPQTGPEGRLVRSVLVEAATPIAEELYLGATLDRSRRCITVMASRAGGVNIEETSHLSPETILTETVDPFLGLRPFQAFRLAHRLGLPLPTARAVARVVQSLVELFKEKDCTLVEINPLAIDERGAPIALDAKLILDDNGLFRHPELQALRDVHEEDPLEVEAAAANLNYIKLDGNVGCLVNGAGLAMATMDLIQHVGARPANFLDVGGGATAEMIERGVRILVGDPDVRAVFINIFGGILRCDVLARGVVEAAKTLEILVPVIVRLEGTNVEAGRRILSESGVALRTAATLAEAATLVAAAVKESS